MPSNSFQRYRANLRDVQSLIDSHGELNHEGGGRRALGHITRSGVVMLCAAFEVYFENIVMEVVNDYYCKHLEADTLPLEVKKTLAQRIKKEDHELACLNLAGNGWKDCLRRYAMLDVNKLNTPRAHVLEELVGNWTGLDKFTRAMDSDFTEINLFVSVRGEIAHQGADAEYVRIAKLIEYKNFISEVVTEFDNLIRETIKTNCRLQRTPWQKNR